MMKKKVLLFYILITGLLLAMTSYAWFSANSIFEIESFDIQVATKGGITISTDANDFKGVIGMLDLINADKLYPNNLNQIPDSVKPFSSAGHVENGLLKMFKGDVEQGQYNYLYAKQVVETKGIGKDAKGEFVSFDVFIKTPTPKFLMLSENSAVSYLTEKSTGIENAFRIAFINEGTVGENDERAARNVRNGTRSYIWEPNSDVHNDFAVKHAKEVYNLDVKNVSSLPISYDGIKKAIPQSLELNVSEANANKYPLYFERVKPHIISTKDNTNKMDLFSIQRGITKIRVYIYLEGQDIDCEDNSNYGNLAINLEFMAR